MEGPRETRIVPRRPAAALAAEALADARHARQVIVDWGVRIPADSRLDQAITVLEQIQRIGTLAADPTGQGLAVSALQTALDYRDIAASLPPHRVASVRKGVEGSLGGTLDPNAANRGPLQLQTQHLVAAAFHRGGADVEYPTHSPQKGVSSPDLLLPNGASLYAVEVKRPEKRHNIAPRFDDAVKQLGSYGQPGAVVIDATDCLRDVPFPDFEAEAHAVAMELYDRVWAGAPVGFRSGYRDVMLVAVVARGIWQTNPKRAQELQIANVSAIARFAHTENSLMAHRGAWMRQTLQDGLVQLGFSSDEEPKPW